MPVGIYGSIGNRAVTLGVDAVADYYMASRDSKLHPALDFGARGVYKMRLTESSDPANDSWWRGIALTLSVGGGFNHSVCMIGIGYDTKI